MQTFSLIKVENIEVQKDLIEIKIPDRIKTSGPNKKQPILIIPFFKENKQVCAASTMQCYITRTECIRKNICRLFITSKSPFRPATSQTLAHWVKKALEKSGLDTNMFSAHSTRHASTSAAKRRGVNIDTLRKTAGWSQNSLTFAKFYDLEIAHDKTEFANAILRKKKL